jgi:hypothetical protein
MSDLLERMRAKLQRGKETRQLAVQVDLDDLGALIADVARVDLLVALATPGENTGGFGVSWDTEEDSPDPEGATGLLDVWVGGVGESQKWRGEGENLRAALDDITEHVT